MGNEQGKEARDNIASMSWAVKQNLLMKGVHYNMKVIIKGERNTGKTSLWRRLQGQPFTDAYVPTPEIQVCNITWNYKALDDTVKVEIWDIVDKAKAKKRKEGSLKANGPNNRNDDEEEDTPDQLPAVPEKGTTGSFTMQLDATTVDIYQGTHAVIMLFDPTKKWTWDYAQKEIEKIPKDLFVLLVANYRDMGEHRAVSEQGVADWVALQNNKNVRYLEASMLNGYGVKGIVTFFNVPFLKQQRAYIEQQLKQNEAELVSMEQLLKDIAKEDTYDNHIKTLEEMKKNRTKATKSPPISPTNSPSPAPFTTSSSSTSSQPASAPEPKKETQQPKEETPTTQPATPSAAPLSKQPSGDNPKSSQPVAAKPPTQPQVPTEPVTKKVSGFFSKVVSLVAKSEDKQSGASQTPNAEVTALKQLAASGGQGTAADVDNFKPSGDLDDDFLSEGNAAKKNSDSGNLDDDDDDKPNPFLMQDEDLEGPERQDEPVVKRKPVPEPPQQQTTDNSPKLPPKQPDSKPLPSNSSLPSQQPNVPPSSSGPRVEPKSTVAPKATSAPQQRPQPTPTEESDDDEKPNSLVLQSTEGESDSDDDKPSPVVLKTEGESSDEETPPPAKKTVPPPKATQQPPAKATLPSHGNNNPSLSSSSSSRNQHQPPPSRSATSPPSPREAKPAPVPTEEDDWSFTQDSSMQSTSSDAQSAASSNKSAAKAKQQQQQQQQQQQGQQRRRKPRPVHETPEEREERKRRHKEKKDKVPAPSVPQKPPGPVY